MRDASGLITAGGTAQTALAADFLREYVEVVNPASATENLFVDFGRTATTNSGGAAPYCYELVPGGSVTFARAMIGRYMETDYVSVIAATTGHKFVIRYV